MIGRDPLLALALAIAAVLAGPLMYSLSRRVRFLLHALDGFVLTAVGSLVLLHIAPRALALGGFWSLALAAIGLALPALFERMVFGRSAKGKRSAQRAERAESGGRASHARDPKVWAIVLGLIGLVSHTLIDGAAIGSEKDPGALSWAIVLHRLPAGILVWWLVRPAFGLKRASLMLAGLIAATIAGFLLGQRFDVVEERSLAIFEAFVAGALLHVLLSHGPELHGGSAPHNRVAELFGAMLGVLMIALMPESSGHEHPAHPGTPGDLLSLTRAIALPLVAGLAIAGLLAAFSLPIGAAAAARRFEQNGNILALALPQLAPAAILVSLVLLGPALTLVRSAAAMIAALAVSGAFRLAVSPVQGDLHQHEHAPSKLGVALRFGFIELMDESAAWILLGTAAYLLLAGTAIDLPSAISVPLAALLALLPFVCAIGATPLVAALIGAGASVGSALAFLIAGSMVHATSLAAIRKKHDRRAALIYSIATFAAAVLIGFAADLLLPKLAPPRLSLGLIGSIDRVSIILLLTLISAALVRLGPRGFVQTLLRPNGSQPHDHNDG